MSFSSGPVIMCRRDAKLYRDFVRPFCKGLLSGTPLLEISAGAIGLCIPYLSRKSHIDRIAASGNLCYIFKAIMKEPYKEFQKSLAFAYVSAVSKQMAKLEDNFEERMKFKQHVSKQLDRIQLLFHSPEVAAIFDELEPVIYNRSFVEIRRID